MQKFIKQNSRQQTNQTKLYSQLTEAWKRTCGINRFTAKGALISASAVVVNGTGRRGEGGGREQNRLADINVETVSDLAHFETPRSSARKCYTHEDIAHEDITLEDVTHTRHYTRRQSKQGSSLKFVHVTFPHQDTKLPRN